MQEISDIIENGENLTTEFKTSFGNEVIETLVAFANAKGGKVLIGVSDDKVVKGITIKAETVQKWINEIKQKTAPRLIPDIEIVEVNQKKVVVFSIQEYPLKPLAFRGRYYKRVSNANHLLSIDEMVNMHLESFNSSWDYHTNNHFKLDNLSLDKIQNTVDIINENGFSIDDDPLSFLFKKDLIQNDKVTNAAYLLFTNNDTVMTTIEMGRFENDITIKDSIRSQTDIISQVNQILEFVKKHINKALIITENARNSQKWQYPLEAIREIVMNMVVHRDYRSSADSIIKIYNHKIEFFNPGRLPEDITEEDLLNNNYKSTPRNKIVADIFRNMGLIEKYGSGIQRIIGYCADEDLPKPTFKNQSTGFLVTIFSKSIKTTSDNVTENVTENVTDNVTDNVSEKRLIQILYLIKDDNTISTVSIATKLGVTKRTILRDIEKLKKKGKIKYRGSPKAGYWQLLNHNNTKK